MEESITQITEKNAMVRDWSLKTQREKGDSLVEGCVANLPEHITVNVRQNNLEDLVQIWNQLDSDTRGIFTERYGDIAHLITIRVDEQLIQAMVRFWDPAYQCFTFNQEDMTPTIEEYAALLRIDNVQFGKIYVKEPKPMTFKKKFGSEPSRHAEKGESIRLGYLRFGYFPGSSRTSEVLGHLEVAVVDFFERLKQGINPVPTILAETFRSLNSYRKIRKGRFIECAQLLNVWILSHFWKVGQPSYRGYNVESSVDSPFSSAIQGWRSRLDTTTRIMGRSWICPAISPKAIFSRQFIPATGGLAQSEFAFTGEGYMKRVRDTVKSWKKVHSMELALYADTLTQDYDLWRKQRVNSQQISSTNYTVQNLCRRKRHLS
ncbi:hypothetical protein CXB51_026109 [Gossypium anomalum]|uniref:DUF7745 domain-containing protein n=1 Tax=Gossypium anomalum TaxID=47600 RepID=A0A8J5YL45_9ROSI|nr:hypothetical protein CXB51_026109 [Gossypium anomalum]